MISRRTRTHRAAIGPRALMACMLLGPCAAAPRDVRVDAPPPPASGGLATWARLERRVPNTAAGEGAGERRRWALLAAVRRRSRGPRGVGLCGRTVRGSVRNRCEGSNHITGGVFPKWGRWNILSTARRQPVYPHTTPSHQLLPSKSNYKADHSLQAALSLERRPGCARRISSPLLSSRHARTHAWGQPVPRAVADPTYGSPDRQPRTLSSPESRRRTVCGGRL
ncbi:hypothetical protein AcW1_003852 [Taiwanofungus camphoratus]|nr:hypothetical protein AcW1_003852 [Antrodia cinnamomea]